MLIRDVAILSGLVSDRARGFAEDIFHYEQRIVDRIPLQKQSGIYKLSEVQKLAPNVRFFRFSAILFNFN